MKTASSGHEVKGHLALSAVALIYGANYLIAKSVMPEPIGPNSFIALRVSGAVILFWLISYRRMVWPARRHWWRFLLCAVCGVATNQLLFFNGLALTSPINASIMMTSNPILVLLISTLLYRQRLSLMKMSGVLIGAAGAVAIIVMSSWDKAQSSHWVGDVFILINSLSWAFYLVMVKPLMKDYHPMVITSWVFLIGLILVLPFGGLGLSALPWEDFTTGQWFAILYVIVFVTFLTYLFNMVGIHYLSPEVASAYIYFQPILAGLFAFLFTWYSGHDYTGDITWLKIGAGLLVFAGVYLVSKKPKTV